MSDKDKALLAVGAAAAVLAIAGGIYMLISKRRRNATNAQEQEDIETTKRSNHLTDAFSRAKQHATS